MGREEVHADILNSIWKFFASLRLTLTVLLTLAATSIIGTLIPQNEDPSAYFRAYGEFRYRLFDVLDLFDMYHSWWFQLLMVLLTINVIVCSIDRLSVTWRIIFTRHPNYNADRFRRLKRKKEFTDPRPLDQLKSDCRAVAKGFHRLHVEENGDGFTLFAEKGRWTRLGVYVVHTSVVLLILGGLVGSIFGFEGFATIPEGESIDSIRLRGSNRTVPLGFAIRCDDFDLSFYESGQPKEYRSSLSIVQNGNVVVRKDIIVNDPLRYQGINIFQSSYGELPNQAPPARTKAPDEVTLNFAVRETGMAYQKKAVLGQPIDLPEGQGTFILERYVQTAQYMGQSIGEAFYGKLTPRSGTPVEVLLPLRFSKFDRMRRGVLIISVLGQEKADFNPTQPQAKRYYTGLQITRDPGVGIVYMGFILMIVGCYVTFFLSHQQICIDVKAVGEEHSVMVAGTVDRNKLAMERRVEQLVDRLNRSD